MADHTTCGELVFREVEVINQPKGKRYLAVFGIVEAPRGGLAKVTDLRVPVAITSYQGNYTPFTRITPIEKGTEDQFRMTWSVDEVLTASDWQTGPRTKVTAHTSRHIRFTEVADKCLKVLSQTAPAPALKVMEGWLVQLKHFRREMPVIDSYNTVVKTIIAQFEILVAERRKGGQ